MSIVVRLKILHFWKFSALNLNLLAGVSGQWITVSPTITATASIERYQLSAVFEVQFPLITDIAKEITPRSVVWRVRIEARQRKDFLLCPYLI
jgi:hypothetical protein